MAGERVAEAQAWRSWSRWCLEQMLLELFVHIDQDGDGTVTAEELMTMLVIISTRQDLGFALDPVDAQVTVQEFDVSGTGCLSCEEFLDMVHQLERENEVADENDEE